MKSLGSKACSPGFSSEEEYQGSLGRRCKQVRAAAELHGLADGQWSAASDSACAATAGQDSWRMAMHKQEQQPAAGQGLGITMVARC
jgi:hypothetical protein